MLYVILAIFTVLMALYGLHFAVIAVMGLIRRGKPNPPARANSRIAVLIPARNEQQVIGYLIESLMKQRYPRELYDVYAIVNNCTDDTKGVALRAGAKVIECDEEVHSKGEVLRYAFDKLLEPDGPAYDAYCIFDADNLVDSGFLQAANNALNAGHKVAQGYRDSKNPRDNWVSGCTSTFFWFMSSLYNRSRANIGMSTSLNGTGIMISDEVIRKQGYATSTLTEDLEYSAQCVLNGYKIGWMNDAIIYDEQPTLFRDSFVQRRRWGAGSLQCSHKYLRRLMSKAIRERNWDCLDLALLFMGMYVQALGCMPTILTIAACVLSFLRDPVSGMRQAYAVASTGIAGGVLVGVGFVFIMAALEKKFSRVGLSTYLMMCVYMISWVPANLMSLVTKAPSWSSIQHISAVDIGRCETENGLPGEGSGSVASRLHHSKETGT